jgi:endonuclease III
MSRLSRLLDELESFHGPQAARWPTDPYQFLVWWHSGYPASEERCTRGWESLTEKIGSSPAELLEATASRLAGALKAGGMIAQLRAQRLKQIAQQVREQYHGDLRGALGRLPLAEVRTRLKRFAGIADPGADRIILFGGLSPLADANSAHPQVLVRIESGQPHPAYNANYRASQQIITTQVADTFAARTRAYLLLQEHGQRVCKRSNPKCSICPLAGSCAFTRRRQP